MIGGLAQYLHNFEVVDYAPAFASRSVGYDRAAIHGLKKLFCFYPPMDCDEPAGAY